MRKYMRGLISLPSDERNRDQTVTKMPHFGPAVKTDPFKADPLARLIQDRLGDFQKVKPLILEHPVRLLGVRPIRSQTPSDTQPPTDTQPHHSYRHQSFMKSKNGKHSHRNSGKHHGKSLKPENLTGKYRSNALASSNSFAFQSTVMLANSSTSQSTSSLLPVDYSMPSRIKSQSSILPRTIHDKVNNSLAGPSNQQIYNKVEAYGKKKLALNASERLATRESTTTSRFTMQPYTPSPHSYNKQHRDVTNLPDDFRTFSGQARPKKRINKHRCRGIVPVHSQTTFTASSLPSLIGSDSSKMAATHHRVTR